MRQLEKHGASANAAVSHLIMGKEEDEGGRVTERMKVREGIFVPGAAPELRKESRTLERQCKRALTNSKQDPG